MLGFGWNGDGSISWCIYYSYRELLSYSLVCIMIDLMQLDMNIAQICSL